MTSVERFLKNVRSNVASFQRFSEAFGFAQGSSRKTFRQQQGINITRLGPGVKARTPIFYGTHNFVSQKRRKNARFTTGDVNSMERNIRRCFCEQILAHRPIFKAPIGYTHHHVRSPPMTGNTAVQEQAARLSLASNIFLVVVKVAAGLASGSISVLAEGVQSTMDVLASALILFTVRKAAEPPDQAHPYGHGKLENLTSQAQMLLILGSAGYLLISAWQRWQNPTHIHLDIGAAALVISIIFNIVVSKRLYKVARETGSQAIEAEATHLRSDLIACVGVLAGLGVVWITKEPRFDPLIAAGMTVFIVVSALKLLRETMRPLLDERLPQDEELAIRKVLNDDERILGFHRLRTRRAGSYRLMDVHILLSDHLSFPAAHAISEEIEDEIRTVLPNVDIMVHAEPYEEELRHQQEHHGDGNWDDFTMKHPSR